MGTISTFTPVVKKLLTIWLILMYGYSSLGMTIQFHYCCGKLESIKVSPAHAVYCNEDMGSKPCCEDKQVSSKHADHEFSTVVWGQFKNCFAIIAPTVEKSSLPISWIKLIPPISISPPSSTLSLFISNCVFRI